MNAVMVPDLKNSMDGIIPEGSQTSSNNIWDQLKDI